MAAQLFRWPRWSGPCSAGCDSWIPDKQCTPAIGTRLRYTTGCLPEMHFTTSGILLKNFEQVCRRFSRADTPWISKMQVKEAFVSVSSRKKSRQQTVESSKQAGRHTTSYNSCSNTQKVGHQTTYRWALSLAHWHHMSQSKHSVLFADF